MKTSRISTIMAALAFALFAFSATPSWANDWDQEPAVKKSVAPKNPGNVSGLVTAIVSINEQGVVHGVEIARSSDASLEAPVVDALKNWLFDPARKDGQAVASVIRVPFQFRN